MLERSSVRRRCSGRPCGAQRAGAGLPENDPGAAAGPGGGIGRPLALSAAPAAAGRVLPLLGEHEAQRAVAALAPGELHARLLGRDRQSTLFRAPALALAELDVPADALLITDAVDDAEVRRQIHARRRRAALHVLLGQHLDKLRHV